MKFAKKWSDDRARIELSVSTGAQAKADNATGPRTEKMTPVYIALGSAAVITALCTLCALCGIVR